MRISHFDGAKDNWPKQGEFSWEYFAANLGPHEYRPGGRDEAEDKRLKEALPCFSPAEYREGGTRGNKDVERVWMLVLDVDHVDEQTARWVMGRVVELGLAAVVYSSWRHGRDPWRFRVIVPLDRPVDGEHWSAFWARAITLFGSICDEACKDPARLFFGPFAPIGTEHLNFYCVYQGTHLSTDAVWALPLPEGVRDTRPEQSQFVKDSEAISMLASTWPNQRRHEAHLALAGGLLSSGFSDERAVEFLCAVASQHDGSDEEREKRENAVEHTRMQLDANENITGWTTLASIVGYDVVEKVRALVERPPDITDEQLLRYAKQLKRSRIDHKAELGDALEKVCQKRVFPEPLALKLAAELGTRFVEYSAQSIAARFEMSLTAMRAEGEQVSVEQVEARVKQKQDEIRDSRKQQRKNEEQREKEVEVDKASRIRQSFNNGRSHPYTADELKQFQPMIGTGHQWILQKDRAFYFFHYGRWRGPYSEAEAHNAGLRELAPAMSAGIELYKVTKDGTDFKSLRQLVAEYGSVADELIVDMRAQSTSYDFSTRRIIEAPCPLRSITPRYHADVDEWLYHLAGPDFWYDLKTWLAILPRLDLVRVALFLTGKKSLGKSLLALGCSRLWTTSGPTSLEAAFGAFNDIVAKCPLCFADEQLPKDFRGYTMNPQLRYHIQATERLYRRKFLPNGKLIGVTPTIVAAHDPSILRTPEELSNNEIEGIMERYFHIPVRDAAGDFLAGLRPTTYERGWVENDVIAEFVMWLAQNHRHEPQGRFYINRPDVENTRWLATSSGARSSVLRWLCAYLADRKKFEGDANTLMHVRVNKGRLLVNIEGLLKYWDKYVGNEKCPSSGKLAQTLAELSHPNRVQLLNGKRVPTNYREVVLDNVYAWAKNSDLITADEIARQLAFDSRETSVGLTA